MKTIVCLALLSLCSLFAEAASSEFGSFGPWANLTALACVICLLMFVICKYIPMQNRERAQEINAARTEYAATLDRMSDRFERRENARDESLMLLTTRIQELAVNCTKHQTSAHRVEV